MVARRGAGSVFAATRYEIDPLPWPLLADVMTTHAAPLDAVQAHSRARSSESVPEPPVAGDVSTEFVRRTLHRELDGAVVDWPTDVHEALAAKTTSTSS